MTSDFTHKADREKTEAETKGWLSGFFFANLIAVAITQRLVFIVITVIAFLLGVTYRLLLHYRDRLEVSDA
jgi:hypothetical protein